MELDTPLTTRQAVVIACRALSLYCLLEAIFNLTYFPGYVGSLLHYIRESHRASSESGYFLGYYARYLAAGVIRLALELFFALWFYRADRGPLQFLLKDEL